MKLKLSFLPSLFGVNAPGTKMRGRIFTKTERIVEQPAGDCPFI